MYIVWKSSGQYVQVCILHITYERIYFIYVEGVQNTHTYLYMYNVDHTASIRCVVLLYVIEDLQIIYSPAVLVM